MVDVVEADEDFRLVLSVNQTTDLFTDLLDIGFVEDVSINELDASDTVLLSNTETGCSRCHSGHSPIRT
jgi:hypothetical protein